MNNDIVPGFDSESDDSIKLKLQKIEGMERGLVIFASGYIDTYNSVSSQKRTEKVVKAGFVQLVLEMSAVSYISSTGVGALAYLLKQVKSQHGDVVLQALPPRVYEVLQLLGLAQFFLVKESFEESLAHFAGHSEPPAFPKVFTCPICNRRLRATRPGRFRCMECKTILVVDQAAMVLPG